VWLLVVLAATFLLSVSACGGDTGGAVSSGEDRPFSTLEKEARGTKVNISMYGGDAAINAYVDDYVKPQLEKKYAITLERTPLSDTADAVNKLFDEKTAGKEKGTIDLVWLNGENFATGADAGLWFGPWAQKLPNAKYIDWHSPSISNDFGYPVEGREAPWGKAQFVMIYDSARVDDPPKNTEELLAWAREHPGHFTYPAPPDFTGNAFIEQVLYGVTGEVKPFQKPFNEKVFAGASSKTYDYLNKLEPNLWRKGETYPESSTKLDGLYQDGEVWLDMSYNPQLAQRQVDKGLFPKSTRTYLFENGTLNNTHYVSIPFNSPNKAGAQVVANFLESPEAQLKKQDPGGWGDLTALDVEKLPQDARMKFAEPQGAAALPAKVLQKNRLPEARSKWLLQLQDGWQENVLKK